MFEASMSEKLLLTHIEEEHEIVINLDFHQFEETFVPEIVELPPIEAADEPPAPATE